MKRRSSREINVFNMSMLDVICSALGAFIILILMADFNRSDAVQTVKRLKAEIRHTGKANRELRQETAELKAKNTKLAKENADQRTRRAQDGASVVELKRCQKELAKAKERRSALTEKVDIYGDPLSGAPMVLLTSREKHGRNHLGPCVKIYYQCKPSTQSKLCPGQGPGINRWGGGGN